MAIHSEAMAGQAEATAVDADASPIEPKKYLFTVDEYYRMGEAGIFGPETRVELIEGEIILMPPIGEPHAGTVDRLNHLLVRLFGEVAIVRVQNPIHLGERSDPQPDFALLRPRADFYTTGHPTPADILLVVEVADSSLRYDTQTKAPLYARAGIPELWVIDLTRAQIVAYWQPSEDGYLASRIHRRGDALRPVSFPELAVAVDDVLG